MKNNSYCIARCIRLRYLAPALLSMGVFLPHQSVGQATNNCNLLPNPSFEQQNVSQPSGNPNNISGSFSDYDEVTGWQAIGSYSGTSTYGKPTYYATNAPSGSATNPFTNPATNPAGSSFQPYNYNPSLHNGALSIIAAEGGYSSPLNLPQYISPNSPVTLVPGATYYASFQAYRSSAPNAPVRLGMNLSQGNRQTSATSTSMQSSGTVSDYAWTRVSGKIAIPNASSDPWYVTIGNISPRGPGARARYYIDEVELYKIPTAGPNILSCTGSSTSSITIGEGCPIPGVTYTWSAPGITGLPTNSSAIQITVNPSVTTTYTLTVNLPDGTNLTTTATVTVGKTLTVGPDINLARQGAANPPSNKYDVRVNNVDGATSFTLVAESPDGNGGWTSATTYQADTYTGPDNPDFNEVRGFTTFHTGYIGPATSGTTSNTPINNPATYRLTVTARSACNSVTTQRVVTLPPYEGGYEESNLTGPTTAYPNPAAESIVIPNWAVGATLVNDKGKAVGRRDNSGKLDVQSLPDGVYNLQMMKNGKRINQRIQVKH